MRRPWTLFTCSDLNLAIVGSLIGMVQENTTITGCTNYSVSRMKLIQKILNETLKTKNDTCIIRQLKHKFNQAAVYASIPSI